MESKDVATQQTALFEDAPHETHLQPPDRKTSGVGVSSSNCHFCKGYIDPESDTTHSEVRSWVHGAKKDSSVLREYTGLHAHGECIAKLRAGLSPLQREILDVAGDAAKSEIGPDVLAIVPDRTGPEYKAGYLAGLHSDDLLMYETSEEFMDGYHEGQAQSESDLMNKMLRGKSE